MAQVQFAVHVLHGFWRVNVFCFHTTNTRVHLLVLQKDYAKTTQRISVKLGWKVGLVSRWTFRSLNWIPLFI